MFILGLFSSAKDSILGTIRTVFLWLDMVSFSYLDNAYELFYNLASQSIIEKTIIVQIIKNIYVLVGIFAFFRIAVFLINSIINPDSLQKEGAGLSKIFVNTVIMIVLLVAMPSIFEWSREITTKVVEKNYIQKLFVNPQEIEKDFSPGKEMQRIAIGTAISVEEDFLNSGTNDANSSCSGDCEKAVKCLNDINGIGDATNSECLSDTGVKWSKLSSYNGLSMKNASGEKLYVYNYKPLIITITGWFITYILLSFSFDVGKRMIELAILEILSPIFIATVVDPKSMSSGAFSRWLKEVKNSYLSLYLRIAAVSILLLCLRLLSYWKSPMSGGIAKLVVLLAFLMFVKQLPKWISNLLGVDGDGTGLGNLGIGKKIGEAALIGGLATKLGHAAAGAATGGAVAVHNQLRNRRQGRKDAVSGMPNRFGLGKDSKDAREKFYSSRNLGNAGYLKKRHELAKARRQAAGEYGRTNKEGIKKGLTQAGASIVGGVMNGVKAGINADGMRGVFSGSINAANQFGKEVGLKGEGIGTKITNAVDSIYTGVKGAYGTPAEIRKRKEDAEDAKKFDSFFSNKSGIRASSSASDTPVGQGSFNKAFQGSLGGIDSVYAAIGAKCDPEFKDAKITTNANGTILVEGNDGKKFTINGETRQVFGSDGSEIVGAYDSMIEKGKSSFTREGLANYENMFVESQRQAVNSVISNNAQMSALMQQRASAEQSISYNTEEARKIAEGAGIVHDGKIVIDDRGTMVKLSEATIDMIGFAVDNSVPRNDEAATAVKDKVKSCEKGNSIIKGINEQIGYYISSNDSLGHMISELRKDEGNKNKTLDELLVILEKMKAKKQKDVDAFEQQKPDSNK